MDSCDPVAGCKFAAKSDGVACAEASNGSCKAGACAGAPCPPGYEAVEVDDGGVKKTACSADGPVWGNRPDKPVAVYKVSEPVGGAGKVVSDSQTKLMWQQGAAGGVYKWVEAKSYCDGLVYAGFKDWRLPSVHELATLVDYSIASPGPTIDQAVFPGTKQNYYWSASVRAGNPSVGWYVNFDSGNVGNYDVSRSLEVRCVRGS